MGGVNCTSKSFITCIVGSGMGWNGWGGWMEEWKLEWNAMWGGMGGVNCTTRRGTLRICFGYCSLQSMGAETVGFSGIWISQASSLFWVIYLVHMSPACTTRNNRDIQLLSSASWWMISWLLEWLLTRIWCPCLTPMVRKLFSSPLINLQNSLGSGLPSSLMVMLLTPWTRNNSLDKPQTFQEGQHSSSYTNGMGNPLSNFCGRNIDSRSETSIPIFFAIWRMIASVLDRLCCWQNREV